MDNQSLKRSDEPIFWGGFGAGGMWLAIISPIIILLVGIILPLSIYLGAPTSAQAILSFFQTIIGKIILLGSIALPMWCGMHRIYHLLFDLKIHLPFAKGFFYGSALFFALLATYFIFLM